MSLGNVKQACTLYLSGCTAKMVKWCILFFLLKVKVWREISLFHFRSTFWVHLAEPLLILWGHPLCWSHRPDVSLDREPDPDWVTFILLRRRRSFVRLKGNFEQLPHWKVDFPFLRFIWNIFSKSLFMAENPYFNLNINCSSFYMLHNVWNVWTVLQKSCWKLFPSAASPVAMVKL